MWKQLNNVSAECGNKYRWWVPTNRQKLHSLSRSILSGSVRGTLGNRRSYSDGTREAIMKSKILKSILGGFLWIIIIYVYDTWSRGWHFRINGKILTSLSLWGLGYSILIFLLFLTINYHLSIIHKGWKRFLVAIFIFLLPFGLLIGYEIIGYAKYGEHLIVISISSISLYLWIIGIYFLVNWVRWRFCWNY